MGLNEVLHKLAYLVGANDSHEIHGAIDDAVEPDKSEDEDEEKGKEETTNA